MAWAGHLGRLLGALVTFVGLPYSLLRPRRTARLLVPRRARGRFARRPLVWCSALAAVVAVIAGVGMYAAVFSRLVDPQTGHGPVRTLLMVMLVFGGPMFAACFRALWSGMVEWRLTGPTSVRGTGAPIGGSMPSAPSVRFDATVPIERPAAELMSRRLRGAARWLAAVGLVWYLFGRVIQVARIGGDDGTEVPSWWWVVTVVLLGAGAAAWVGRRLLRYWDEWSAGPTTDAPDVLQEWGFQLTRPAGPWVRERAPEVFLAADDVGEGCLWPWAAVGEADGHALLVAHQIAQVRNSTGLTSTRSRTACVIQVVGAQLPLVIVSGREAVPPVWLGRSLVLELETFNRQLWAWGPDRRGAHGVLHPRVIAPLLRDLPDGAVVTFARDRIAIHNDEPVRGSDMATYLTLCRQLASLLPSYMVGH